MIGAARQLWSTLPAKWAFFAALAVWTALFHFLGNSVLGYVHSNSIFVWLKTLYANALAIDNDDQICAVVPFLVLGLFLFRSPDLIGVPKRPWPAALGLLSGAILLHGIGYAMQQTRISVAAYLLGAYALMGLFWGRDWIRASAFPYFVLLFAIPFSTYLDTLTFQLRLLSSMVSTEFSRHLLGLPIERIGTKVIHPAGPGFSAFEFEVAPACSGIRSIVVVLLLTVSYSFLVARGWRRWLIIGVSPLLALAGNFTRLVATFWVADHWGERAGKAIESNGGFVTFLVALGGIVLLSWFLPEGKPPETPKPASAPIAESSPPRFAVWSAALALALMAAGALSVRHLKSVVHLGRPGVRIVNVPVFSDDGAIARRQSISLPSAVPGFASEDTPVQAREASYLPPDTLFGRKSYYSRDRSLSALASVVLMGNDRTSIHKPESCLTGIGWKIRRSTKTSIALDKTNSMEVARFDMELTVPSAPNKPVGGVYVFWFVADGARTSDHFTRQWSMARSLATAGEVQRWAYISFFTSCPPGHEDAAFEKLTNLIRLAQPEIEQGQIKRI